ncbi:MAG TPA: DMT family transporter [Vicinamibacterales bacterium]
MSANISVPVPATAPGPRRRFRLVALTAGALIGFSANSILARLALDSGAIDASSFVIVRVTSGAAMLALLAGWRSAMRSASWPSAAALGGYALAFTFAYLRIEAAVGALLLFGSVQATMIVAALARGERPSVAGWAGLVLAIAGLLLLTAPGLTAPDPAGAVLMIAAGMAWGVYSLRGRRARAPLAGTAGNFILAVPIVLVGLPLISTSFYVTNRGLLLAATSGAATSGLAYAAWYAALPFLTAWRAAIVQLSVPVVTALAAVAILDERLTLRLVLSSTSIIGGVLLSVTASQRRQ